MQELVNKYSFQFLHGSIKAFEGLPTAAPNDMFQFLHGSIKAFFVPH